MSGVAFPDEGQSTGELLEERQDATMVVVGYPSVAGLLSGLVDWQRPGLGGDLVGDTPGIGVVVLPRNSALLCLLF